MVKFVYCLLNIPSRFTKKKAYKNLGDLRDFLEATKLITF